MTKRIAREMLIRIVFTLIITFFSYAYGGTDTQAAAIETHATPVETPAKNGTVMAADSGDEEQEAGEEGFEEYYEMFVHGMAEMVETFEQMEE